VGKPKSKEMRMPRNKEVISVKVITDITESDTKSFAKEFENETDRAAAVLAAAFLASLLKDALKVFLIEDEKEVDKLLRDPLSPLQSFYGRSCLSYVLGLIGKATRDELLAIGEIRNVFGHKIHGTTFRTPEVIKKCKKLAYPKQFKTMPRLAELAPRSAFKFSVVCCMVEIQEAILKAGKEKRIVIKEKFTLDEEAFLNDTIRKKSLK
jgi:hypothetical protein